MSEITENSPPPGAASIARSGGNPIAQAWLVILLALIYGAALATVQTTLSPKIEANIRAETYDQIPRLVTGAVSDNTVEHRVTGMDAKDAIISRTGCSGSVSSKINIPPC